MLDELLGIRRGHDIHEVRAPHLEHAIDETFELHGSRHGQMTFENDPIKAVQRADDEARKLGQKGPYYRHGILPRVAVVITNHSDGRMPSFPSHSAAASPR
jgi:hypothetical protein